MNQQASDIGRKSCEFLEIKINVWEYAIENEKKNLSSFQFVIFHWVCILRIVQFKIEKCVLER